MEGRDRAYQTVGILLFGYVPQLTELLVTVEDESYTCNTGNEKSYRSNDCSADNAIQKELLNGSLMNFVNQE
jgi:hypothetical protein